MATPRCPIDGKRVPCSKGSRERVYCSDRCRNVASQRAFVERHGIAGELKRPCLVCSKTFSARGQGKGGQRYCSKRCHDKAKAKRERRRALIVRAERLLERIAKVRAELKALKGHA